MVESTRDSVKCFHFWKHFNQSPTSSLFTITSYFTTWTRFAAAKPRRLQQSTGHRFRSLLPIESPAQRVSIGEEKSICKGAFCFQQNAEFAKRTSTKWWAKMDSNHRPHDYQSCALASWAIGPFWWRLAGSNRWPPACKAGALPAELNPQIFFHLLLRYTSFCTL